MVQFFEELQGVATPPLTKEELIELEQLRQKYEKLKNKKASSGSNEPATGGAAAKKQKKKKDSDESGSSSDSEGEEDVGELPMVKPMAAGSVPKRISVSAEVYGRFNKKEEFVPIVIAKHEDDKAK